MENACPQCGRPTQGDGFCPVCLLRLAADQAGPSTVGDAAARWRLLSVLGGGPASTTYLATADGDERLKYVVVKLVEIVVEEATGSDRLRSGQRRLAALGLPAAAMMIDAGLTSHRRPYFVFEHAPGQTIDEYIRRHRLETEVQRALIDEIARTLASAHRAGIAHGAVRVSNVRVAGRRDAVRPKLLELGVRQLLSELDDAPVTPPTIAGDVEALAEIVDSGSRFPR